MKHSILRFALISLAAGTAVAQEAQQPDPASAAAETSAQEKATPDKPAAPAPKSTPPRRDAPQRIELKATQITGNRELPKVLYIVPWKKADSGDLTGKPMNSLLDEVLTPVDREVFRRENRYYSALQPDTASPVTGAAPPATDTAAESPAEPVVSGDSSSREGGS